VRQKVEGTNGAIVVNGEGVDKQLGRGLLDAGVPVYVVTKEPLKLTLAGHRFAPLAVPNLWPTGIGFWIELGYERASHRSRPERDYSDARGGRHFTLTVPRFDLHLIVRRLRRRPMLLMVAMYAAKRATTN
jgi:hypothetical protein